MIDKKYERPITHCKRCEIILTFKDTDEKQSLCVACRQKDAADFCECGKLWSEHDDGCRNYPVRRRITLAKKKGNAVYVKHGYSGYWKLKNEPIEETMGGCPIDKSGVKPISSLDEPKEWPKERASEPVYNGRGELIRYDPTPKELMYNQALSDCLGLYQRIVEELNLLEKINTKLASELFNCNCKLESCRLELKKAQIASGKDFADFHNESEPDEPQGRKVTPKQLHDWYLEVTSKLHPMSYNAEAQVEYEFLSNEQQYIDEYIADKINGSGQATKEGDK